MIILGLSCYYHDSAACLIKDGVIVAAVAEERFSRIKHDNSFPINAIIYCLNTLRIAINEVDRVVFYEKPVLKFERIISQYIEAFPHGCNRFIQTIPSWIHQKLDPEKVLREYFHYVGNICYLEHHLSHAASAYYLSCFSQSVLVTIDGVGEWATTTVGWGEKNKIRIDKEIDFPHSLGLFYSSLTAFLGFEVNEAEYKVMGLAAYGDSRPYQSCMDQLIQTFPDGSFSLNMKYFDFTTSESMFSNRIEELFHQKVRLPGDSIQRNHENIAASLQLKLEEVVFRLLNVAYDTYRDPHLCLAGGVALNSVMNAKIIHNTHFTDLYIPPDPGDGGAAMGAALYVQQQCSSKNNYQAFFPYLGPSYGRFDIEKALQSKGLLYTFYKDKNELINVVAQLLVGQSVVGWFQGRMEWGPRALGDRSILASASNEEMRDIINLKVKKREMFRPFAPVLPKEEVSTYFESSKQPSRLGEYMLIVLPFKSKGKREAPAAVHVDGTGRLQMISRSRNPLYYDLIRAYEKISSSPIIINTSFNVKGEPIVCAPDEAIDCFLQTEIDVLVIGDYLVTKEIG